MTGLTEEQLDHYKNKGYVSPVNALTSIAFFDIIFVIIFFIGI